MNFGYFAIGLLIGLAGMWQNQRFFVAQQQDKFDQIREDISGIRERLSEMAETSSERTARREELLLEAAFQKAALATATSAAAADMKEVIVQELAQAGLPDALERTAGLERKLGEIVEASTRVGVPGNSGDDGEGHWVVDTLARRAMAVVASIPDDGVTMPELIQRLGMPVKAVNDLLRNFYELRVLEDRYGRIVPIK
jgi:hypothetical protein